MSMETLIYKDFFQKDIHYTIICNLTTKNPHEELSK